MQFTPELFIPSGTLDASFYTNALGAKEQMRFNNDDDSIHVIEFIVEDTLFFVHEDNGPERMNPTEAGAVTCNIGLMTDDVDGLFERAINAGATEMHPPTDYDYGYRQASFKDPFGHTWMVQKKI